MTPRLEVRGRPIDRLLRRAGLCLLLLTFGCGKDYEPPALETTGIPAAPLDQVLDLEISLPGLQVMGAMGRGVDLEVQLEIPQTGFGQFPARISYGSARVDGREVPVQDLSGGRTTVTVTPDRWLTEPLGPLVIETTALEVLLDGVPAPGGRFVSGDSYETVTATRGAFQAWRRQRFLVAGTDFFSDVGIVSEVAWVKGREIRVRNQLEFVTSDTALHLSGGGMLAINRLTFDNLQRLDPASDFRTSWQAGVGSGANPHDALLLDEGQGYVTRYEPPYNDIAVFDPRRGTIIGSIPLGPLAENPHGTPRADALAIADGAVFVGLQDIDRTFTRFAEGKLAVIDPALDEVVGTIPLGGKNPGDIEVLEGADGRYELYVALAGIFPGLQDQELSGGVVVVDVTNRAVERWALDDDDVGGNVGALAMASERLGYVVVSDEAFVNRITAFDASLGEALRTVWESFDFIPDLEVDTAGVLAVPDRSFFQPRLCLYRTPDGPEGMESPIGCGALPVPPFSVEALD